MKRDEHKITRPSGDWLEEGYEEGVVVRDARSPKNDGVYIITDVTGTTLTVVKATRWQRFLSWLKQRRRKR